MLHHLGAYEGSAFNAWEAETEAPPHRFRINRVIRSFWGDVMEWKDVLCRLIGHKWEYLFKVASAHRGCLRCGKCECQIYSISTNPHYWHPADPSWMWPELKEMLVKLDKFL